VKSRIRLAAWCSVPIAALVVALVLATSGSASISHPARVNALVVGRLMACAGRPSGRQCFPEDRAVVSAFSSSHRLVATEKVTNGHFAFLVRPGRFELAAKCSCGAEAQRSVTAKANKTVHTSIVYAFH
jgi:hypothetical protein